MPRVKFNVDTVHPDYGEIRKGEVLSVPALYAEHYAELEIAEETEDDLSRPEPKNATQRAVEPPRIRRLRAAARGQQEEDNG